MIKLRLLVLLALAMLVWTLTGCATTASQPQLLANVHAQVLKACVVVPPSISSMQLVLSSQPPSASRDMSLADLNKISNAMALGCAMAAKSPTAISIATVADFVNTNVPKVLTIVANSKMSDQQKTTVQLSLVGVQVGLNMAIAQVPAAPVAASQ